MRHASSVFLCSLLLFGGGEAVHAEEAAPIPTLEQLVNVNVTSVSKKEENAYKTPNAVYVITAEDIRRTGATTIPEVLRLVPGLSVARAGSSGWAISSRGFNGEFANKMLVLMDGRTVYSPIFAGVYWSEQQQFLDNIERIEVIRGPAGAIWGANAMNGVINIITKNAKDTQGGVVQGRLGNNEDGGGTRYGGKIGEESYYRATVSHNDFGESQNPTGQGLRDKWQYSKGAFRTDLKINDRDSMTVQGDYYDGQTHESRILPDPNAPFATPYYSGTSVRSGNLNVNWNRKYASGSELSLRSFYDENHRIRDITGEHQVQTFDTELQHRMKFGERHDFIWGLGYRLVDDHLDGSDFISFDDTAKSFNLFSSFAQDEIELIKNSLYLTLGSKFEHNDFSGFEVQPNARLSWLVDENTTVWGAVSRAVRSPNRAAEDVRFSLLSIPGRGVVTYVGQDFDEPEKLIAYETGLRTRVTPDIALDATAFYNDYSDLLQNTPGTPFTATSAAWGSYTVLPLTPGAHGKGNSYGAELAAYWDVYSNWRLRAAYSFFKADLNVSSTSLSNRDGSVPENQLNFRSYWDVDPHHQIDTMVYLYDNTVGTGIDGYMRTDMRLGWNPTPNFDLSLIGQNLLDNQHPEFTPFTYDTQSEIGRTFYLRGTWRF